MRVLGLIPARGGSKALPDKNITPLAGRSLVHRAFDCATASGVLDRIILSTDSKPLLEEAERIGLEAPFVRPAVYAADDSAMIDVVVHALESLAEAGNTYDAVMLLQPTSPMRKPDHIRRALDLLEDNDAVCSVVAVPKDVNPFYLMKRREDGYLDFIFPESRSITRRQDLPEAYRRDGTLFLTRRDVLLEQRDFYGSTCVPYELQPDEILNIDTPEDWAVAEQRLAEMES